MSGAELVFLIFAALTVGGAFVLLRANDPRRMIGGFALVYGALAAIHVLLVAPVVAVVHLLVGGGLVLAVAPVASGLLGARRPIGRAGLVLGGLSLGVLAFVLLGTLARQYLSYGAELEADPGFGGFTRLAADLMGPRALALDVVGLVLLVAVVAVVLAARVYSSSGPGRRADP